ncbi:DNA repair protein RecO [Paenibacillus albiflavus]|uniref:DNA repair protein RecO n=1 Tax=Paenibacillus albiflavus TaxID=2545760 RepID=A0A4R4E8T6_9BACL|nr:DNA repair protein RecO [Paenibacillus albiflavus]TCZ75577.1 DNA repair protein RecO [Paenibacillus albiflavus]
MLHRVEGIVLRSMDYGEGNKIITLYTREMGKVSVMARGAKKVKSRLGAVTQLFTFGEYVFYKSGQMGTLNNGELLKSFNKLREDLYKSAYSAYLVELIDRMSSEEDASAYLFEQLKAGLEAIDEDKDMAIVAHLLEMKLLGSAGYSPELEACVSCGSITPRMLFSARLGGVICSSCSYKDQQAIAMSDATWKLLRLFKRLDLRRLGAIDVKQSTKDELKSCMRTYMDTHVGIRFKSRSFLEQMEKYDI